MRPLTPFRPVNHRLYIGNTKVNMGKYKQTSCISQNDVVTPAHAVLASCARGTTGAGFRPKGEILLEGPRFPLAPTATGSPQRSGVGGRCQSLTLPPNDIKGPFSHFCKRSYVQSAFLCYGDDRHRCERWRVKARCVR